MNEQTNDPNVKIIKNASLEDVLPGDHLTWEWVMVHGGLTMTNRREGIASYQNVSGDWWTAEDMSITEGNEDDTTLTIRRAVQELPTEDGAVIVPADGHEYITATVGGVTYRAREAILIGENQWHAAWRSDEGVLIYVTPERIDAGTWKVGNR